MAARAVGWAVLAGAFALLLARASSVPLLDPDESRYARTSVEMIRAGDLVVPQFGGEPRLVKPPLWHWIQSLAFHALGESEWVARLPAALSTLGSIFLVGWIARRRFGEEGGVWAAACLITMPLVFVLGKLGTLDALLAVHVLAVLVLDRQAGARGATLRPAVMGALLGLAFLAKGPVGVVLPLLLILAGRTAVGDEILPRAASALEALGAWCAVVLPWGLVFLRRIGAAETGTLVKTEVLERFFAGTIHVEPPWFFAAVACVAFLPWLGPLLVGFARAWQLRRDPAARTGLYAAAGFVTGLVFFSLSRDKLPSYILPLAPLAALVVTWELGQELKDPRRRTTGPTLLAATLAAGAVLLALAASRSGPGEGSVGLAARFGVAVFVPGSLAAGYGVIRRRPRWVYASAVASMGVFLWIVTWMVFPEIGERRSAGSLAQRLAPLAAGRQVATVERKLPSLLFYLDRPVEALDMPNFVRRLHATDEPLFVFDEHDLPAIPAGAADQIREVLRVGRYVVYEKRPPGD